MLAKVSALLLNPQTLAALRNVLSALGLLLATVGVIGLSPTAIEKIVTLVQQVGVFLTALGILVGLLAPIYSMIVAAMKANPLRQVFAVSAAANDPTNPDADKIKVAMINETANLPEVDKVVAPAIADAVPAENVVSK